MEVQSVMRKRRMKAGRIRIAFSSTGPFKAAGTLFIGRLHDFTEADSLARRGDGSPRESTKTVHVTRV